MNGDSAASKSQGDTTITRKRPSLPRYLAREPVIVALLSVLALVFFLAVTGLSHIFHAQQESLGDRWFTRGTIDLKHQRFQPAVSDFRTALLYSRDNYAYQLNLAEALIGLRRTSEANAYLVNLWDREPDNGLVNLELARIAVQNWEIEQALRYYHNAIYATWPGDQEVESRETRLELIEFLLGTNAKTQAQSELIALAANSADDPSQHVRIGKLYLQAQDSEHALAEFLLSLKSEPQNPAALAGAGRAALELGRYAPAQLYLQAAVMANPGDAELADDLKDTALVLRMDPFQRQISLAQKNRIVIADFAAAGEQVKTCAAAGNSKVPVSSPGSQPTLAENWTKMKPQITEAGLRRKPELVEAAMDLVFDIERKSNIECGAPRGTDKALLLISKLHEGN